MLSVKVNSNVTQSKDINDIYSFVVQNTKYPFETRVIEPIFKDYLKLTQNKKVLAIIENLNKTINFISKGLNKDGALIDDFSADLTDSLITYKSDFISNMILSDKKACEYVLKMLASSNKIALVETEKY